MKEKDKKFVEFSVRVPVKVHDKLAAECEKERRTKNQQICVILERRYEEEMTEIEKEGTA